MFKSRYIFESNQTRLLRYIVDGIKLFSIFSIVYIFTLFCFIMFSKQESKKAQSEFFKNSPDLITVFTGDSGRIHYALNKVQQHQMCPIFITGVYSRNSVETIVSQFKNKLPENFEPNLLEIDYQAKNTIGNVLSTISYLKKSKDMKKILIISHDYHILRIKILFKVLSQVDTKIYFEGIETNLLNWRNFKILNWELIKLIKTLGVLPLINDNEASYNN